jgi:hypothetical protein
VLVQVLERVLVQVLERVLVQVLVQVRVLVQEPEPVREPEWGLHKQPNCLPASLLILMQILVSCSNHPPCLNLDCETAERWSLVKTVTSFHTR